MRCKIRIHVFLFLTGALISCSSEPDHEAPVPPGYDPAARLCVEGSMIDIREVAADAAIYPQNDVFTFPQQAITTLGAGTRYATSLREYRGVERVSAESPTTLRIALPEGTDPGRGWTDAKNGFQSGPLRFRIYTRRYDTPGEKVEIPAGKSRVAPLLLGKEIVVGGVPDPPGTVIAAVTQLRARNITNPSIMILSDGSYFVGSSGPDPKGNTYFQSMDKGRSWQKRSNPDYMNFCKCFTRPDDPNTLYELGISAATRGNIVIRNSRDNGQTWSAVTTLFKGDYHGAPTPFIEYKDRIWHAVGMAPADGKMGIAVLSIPADADPMSAANWTLSNILTGNSAWLAGNARHVFNEWQEGCIVVNPENKLKIVTRVDDSKDNDLAALISVSDRQTITFNPKTDFCDMPGGGKKFTIRYDAVSRKYWTLVNPCYDEDRVRTHSGWYNNRIYPIFLRSRLVLCSSTDLRRWTVEKEAISSNNCFFHGFQYVDWVFDGDDIIAVSRTAFPETRGLPARQHDANFLTFHRISNFRNAGFETEHIGYDQL